MRALYSEKIDNLSNALNEKYWTNFVSAFENSKVDISELNDYKLPNDIKIILIQRMGKYAKDWLEKVVPALDNYKPIDLSKTEEGIKAIKMVLLSMPD